MRTDGAGDEVMDEAKRVFQHLATDFLVNNVSDYDISGTYNIPNAVADPVQLMQSLNVDTFPSYLQPIFSPDNGEIVSFDERFYDEQKEEGNAQRSMSIRRFPNIKAFHNLRGSSSNVPFLPGGFDEEMEKLFRLSDCEEMKNKEEEEKYLNSFMSELLNTPPGFANPVLLPNVFGESSTSCDFNNQATSFPLDMNANNILSILNFMDDAQPSMELNSLKNSVQMSNDYHSQSIIRAKQLRRDKYNFNEFHSDFSSNVNGLEEAIRKNVAPKLENEHLGKLKRRAMNLGKDEQFLYAQMIDLSSGSQKYVEMKELLAKSFPFELDPFQQHAVVSMEEGTSVFIAAHTSAGKTVVAEYAIALCKIHKTRVIYTSPIKALSNQKYRDFKLTFGDVGLVTGDIQLNTDAFCLIMTTEILRSMIYNGSETIRELEWVIFDEVHYINDEERGYVWEEILIMLPSHVKIVMLSATVPNCMEFADWVGRIKNRKINVIQTSKRPVPLEHYLYTGKDGKTKNDMFLVLNKDSEFLTFNYKKAVEAKKKSMAKNMAPDKRQYAHANDRNIYINLIDHLSNKDLLPMVVFVFSRKRCDQAASLLQSIDLTSAKEKSEIHRFFTKCIDRLKGSDRLLPQLLLMQEHCKRGFAVHHSGILPIIKEVVELLFQKGYVKILFATETFAMGVNMPARTVVFDTIEKFDGNNRRFLNSTEYVQMAGRAGRRGLDSTGTVIIISKGPNPPELLCLTNMLLGKPIHLESRFRITYGMILNLLRVEQLRIEDMLQRSFVERNSLRLMSSRKEQLQELADQIRDLPLIDCPICMPPSSSTTMADTKSALPIYTPLVNKQLNSLTDCTSTNIMDYFEMLRLYMSKMAALWPELVLKYGVDKYFNPGRVLIINYPQMELCGRVAILLETTKSEGVFYMSLLISSTRDFAANAQNKIRAFEQLSVEERRWFLESRLLTYAAVRGLEAIEPLQIGASNMHSAYDRHSYFILENVGLESLSAICKQSVKVFDAEAIKREFHGQKRLNRDVSPTCYIRNMVTQINHLSEAWASAPPPSSLVGVQDEGNVKPIYVVGKDITKNEISIHYAICEVRDLRVQLMDTNRFPCQTCSSFEEHFKQLLKRVALEERRKLLVFQTSSDGLLMSRDYADRLCVLKALDYVDKNNMTGLKGKVACEINHLELLITELMLENKFEGLSCPEIAALLSPLTCKVSVSAKSSASVTSNNTISNEHNVRLVPSNEPTDNNCNPHTASTDNDKVDKDKDSLYTAKLEKDDTPAKNRNGKNVKNKCNDEVERAPTDVIEKLRNSLLEVALRIDSIQESCNVYTYVTNELNYGLMETVYQWASGMPFSEIMKLTDTQEGIIVRCIQRLDEVLKDVRKAARIIGNPDLYERMEETSAAIKRDIVFAASLYTVEN